MARTAETGRRQLAQTGLTAYSVARSHDRLSDNQSDFFNAVEVSVANHLVAQGICMGAVFLAFHSSKITGVFMHPPNISRTGQSFGEIGGPGL